jgi:MFS family permease
MPRKILFAATIFFGEVPCLMTYFVRTYQQLFWVRALTGISIGGALPLSFSLLGDMFDSSARSFVAAFFSLATGIGILGGQLMAGFVGTRYGWRLPFVLVAIPNMVLTVVIFFLLKEPHRGQMETALVQEIHIEVDPDGKETTKVQEKSTLLDTEVTVSAYSEKLDLAKAIKVFHIPTNLLAFAQGIPGTVPWGAIFVYLNDYLAQDKGLGTEMATLVLTVFNVGGLLGGLVGGLLGQLIYNWKRRWLPVFMGVSTCTGAIPILYLINAQDQHETGGLVVSFFISMLGGVLTAFSGANVRACLLNVNTPETRGTVFSLFNLMDDLGKGFGPFLVALFVGSLGRDTSLNLATMFWVICGILQFCILFTIERDVVNMETWLQNKQGTGVGRPTTAEPPSEGFISETSRTGSLENRRNSADEEISTLNPIEPTQRNLRQGKEVEPDME